MNFEKKLIEDLEELKKYRQLGTVEELAKRIPEEKVLKFYYCESLDKYLVGIRCGTMYYAELTENHCLCMIMSRYLPWGKHIVDETTLWKEHTYPSEPKEIPFDEWLRGYINQQPKLDVPDNNVGKKDREFEELEVTYPPDDVCTYPEYRGKPYFAIKYKENGEHFVGYGTYKPEVLSRYLRDYFMPSAMPQEPKWIPIKHDPQSGWLYNLPDDGQEVLVCWSKYGRITLDTFVNEGEDGCWWENGDLVEVGQAWMPLPPAYKGE